MYEDVVLFNKLCFRAINLFVNIQTLIPEMQLFNLGKDGIILLNRDIELSVIFLLLSAPSLRRY